MEKNMILGLDVSTSTIGVSLFKDCGEYGELYELTHISPTLIPVRETMMENLWEKAELFREFLQQKYKSLPIGKVVIEEPLKNSANPNTAAMLNIFAGMIYGVIVQEFNIYPSYISVDEARRFGLPEIYAKANGAKKPTLFGNIPNKIEDTKITEYRKIVILSLVAQRFKDIVWMLSNNLTIDKKNCDRADSIVAVLGYMAKEKKWSNIAVDVEQSVNFITENIKYLSYIDKNVDSDKSFNVNQKRDLKREYLKEVFKISDYLNISI